MLNSYSPQARRPPATSRVQLSYSKPSPWSRRASPASRIRAKEVFYKDDDRRFGHRKVWSVLEEPLIVCPVKAGAPSENHGNKAAFDLGYYGSRVTLSPWSSIIPSNLSTAYALSLRPTEHRSEFYVAAGKQSGRILSSEDDIGDTLLVNVILPVVEILNKLVDPGLQEDLLIVPAREASKSTGKSPSTNKRKLSISLDHAIQLVSRRVYNYHKVPRNEDKIKLVIIEEKKVPFVLPDQWTDASMKVKGSNMREHLPQILMYADMFECTRLLFTDWKAFVAVHARVTKSAALKEQQEFEVAYKPGRSSLPSAPPSSFDAFHSGLRHALCMLGVDALRELGILRRDTFPLHRTLQPFPEKVVSRRIEEILQAARGQIDNLHYTDTRFEEMSRIPVFATSLQDPELLFRRQERQARQAASTVPPPNFPPPLFYAPSMPHGYTYR